ACRKALRAAAREYDISGAAVAQVAQPSCELLRGVLLAGGIEQHERGAWGDLEPAQGFGARVAQFVNFDFGMAPDARGVVLHQRATFLAARLPDHYQADFHECVNAR